MIKASDTIGRDDPFDLNRFTSAQERIYDSVLPELRSGQKRTHWMWYIFPQIDGLGHSTTSKHYAIKSIHYRTLVLSSLAVCSERLSHRRLSLASATNPEGADEE